VFVLQKSLPKTGIFLWSVILLQFGFLLPIGKYVIALIFARATCSKANKFSSKILLA